MSAITSSGVSRETQIEQSEAVSRETRPSLAARVVLLPVRAYRRFFSPAISPRCRYYPSCSAYAEESIRELGAVRGSILAAWRLLRCNPLSKGGVDKVSDRRLFRPSDEGHNHPTEANPA